MGGRAVFSEETKRMVMEARSRKRKREPPPPPVMRLHILRGSLSGWKDPGDACGAGGGGPAMDPSLWSRLPDDIMWRVLRFLSVVKRFQLQSVSRKWQQELTTSPLLRCCNTIMTSVEKRVVACATPCAWVDKRRRRTDREVDPRYRLKLQAVDVDLSFVPGWFWEPGRSTYSVVAAGDGLVCISNDMDFTYDRRHWESMARCRAKPTLYCVLNPLTRTCVVLPPLPFPDGRPKGWLAPAAGVVTAYSDKGRDVATFDLAAVGPGAGAGRWSWTRAPPGPPIPVQCAGETFRYSAGRFEIQDVLAPVPAGSAAAAAVASLDGPSVALLGLDTATIEYRDEEVHLVPHRGAVFFVAHLRDAHDERQHPEFVAGVWRLGRGDGGDRSVAWWELVTLLREQDKRRIVVRPGSSMWWFYSTPHSVNRVSGAFSVLDLLCCELVMGSGGIEPSCVHFVVGFQLDTGEWEQVLGYEDELGLLYRDPENGELARARPVELRPDVYLA